MEVSAELRTFVEALPLVRRSIFAAVREFARGLPEGTRVLDAGAGEAHYAEMFRHCDYVTADWANSPHARGRRADIVASLTHLPVADASFGAVLSTEVLEHVAEPSIVLSELYRVLEPGGRLCLTTPFVWPLHEEPFDFYRYTAYALRHLLERAGFVDIDIAARQGYFSTLAQVAQLLGWLVPASQPPADLDSRRSARWRRRVTLGLTQRCVHVLVSLASRMNAHEGSYAGVNLPLGYRSFAKRPRAER